MPIQWQGIELVVFQQWDIIKLFHQKLNIHNKYKKKERMAYSKCSTVKSPWQHATQKEPFTKGGMPCELIYREIERTIDWYIEAADYFAQVWRRDHWRWLLMATGSLLRLEEVFWDMLALMTQVILICAIHLDRTAFYCLYIFYWLLLLPEYSVHICNIFLLLSLPPPFL